MNPLDLYKDELLETDFNQFLVEDGGVLKANNDNKTFKSFTLENGLRCLTISGPHNKTGPSCKDTVSCVVVVNVGYLDDPIHCQGLANAVEQIIQINSLGIKSEDNFCYYLKSKGYSLTSETCDDETRFFFKVKTDLFEEGFKRFIKMLFNPDFIQQKDMIMNVINLLDDEFYQTLCTEKFKVERTLAELVIEDHPLGFIHCGNKESLIEKPKLKGRDIYQEVVEFWKKFYVPSNMFLLICEDGTLLDLEEMTYETIGSRKMDNFIERPLRMTSTIYKSPYTDNWAKNLMILDSEFNGHQLEIFWSLPTMFNDAISQSWEYFERLIVDRREGGISYYLENINYIDSMSAYSIHNRFEHLLSITFLLTQEGLNNLEHLVDSFFAFIASLDKRKVNQYEYDKLLVSDINTLLYSYFYNTYDEMIAITDYCFYIPTKYLYITSRVTVKPNFDQEKDFISRLHRDKAQFILTSSSMYNRITTPEIENKSAAFKYKQKPINEMIPVGSVDDEILAKFHEPEPNQYVPENFTLIKETRHQKMYDQLLSYYTNDNKPKIDETIRMPDIIAANDLSTVYHLPHENLIDPYVLIDFKFLFRSRRRVESRTCAELFALMINDRIEMIFKSTFDHGYSCKFQYKKEDTFELLLIGYSDKLQRIFDRILRELMDYDDIITPELFQRKLAILNDENLKSLKGPDSLALDLIEMVRSWDLYNFIEENITSIKLDWNRFNYWMDELKITKNKTIASGNIKKHDIVTLVRKLEIFMDRDNRLLFPTSEKNPGDLPYGDYLVSLFAFSSIDKSSCVSNVYYLNRTLNESSVHCVKILSRLMTAPLFERMLSRSCEVLDFHDKLVIRMKSANENFQCSKADDEIEEFVKWFLDVYLENMDENQLSDVIRSEILTESFIASNAAEEFGFVSLLVNFDYDRFENHQGDKTVWNLINLERFRKWARRLLGEGKKRRKLSVYVIGNNREAMNDCELLDNEELKKLPNSVLNFDQLDEKKMLKAIDSHETSSLSDIIYLKPKNFDKEKRKLIVNIQKFCEIYK